MTDHEYTSSIVETWGSVERFDCLLDNKARKHERFFVLAFGLMAAAAVIASLFVNTVAVNAQQFAACAGI